MKVRRERKEALCVGAGNFIFSLLTRFFFFSSFFSSHIKSSTYYNEFLNILEHTICLSSFLNMGN